MRHETCAAHVVDDAARRLLADVQIGRERRVDFSLAAIGTQPFGAIVCPPVGAQAPLPDGQPFTPPWAE
ncbi:MAG TPA: hypothetical protein VFD90_19350 [Gaiellales bacterium]|nr:hypothetical protein [Gaiellales bacterium]